MKRNWSVIALMAGGVLLGGAHGALADRQREGRNVGSRYVRNDWHPVQDREDVARHERLVEVRDGRSDRNNCRVVQPFAYVRAADLDRFSHRDCR
jgi:hypothetical protein